MRFGLPIFTVFFLHAMAFANWLPRIPSVKASLQLSDAELGYCLMGASLGTFVVLPISHYLIERIGLNRSILVLSILFFLLMPMAGFAWNGPALFVALALVGFCVAGLEVAINTKADEMERASSRRVMTTCHGFWSMGTVAGAFIGSIFAGYQVQTGLHLLLVAPFLIAGAAWAVQALPASSTSSVEGEKTRKFVLPGPSLIGLCLLAFSALAIEGSIMDWSAVYLSDVLDASPFESGLAFTVFAVTMTTGRLSGDWLRGHFSSHTLLRLCGAFALVGLVIAFTSTYTPLVFLGFAIAGLGISIIYPLVIVAAAGRGDRPAAVNVASLSMISFMAFLACPPLIGLASEWAGLQNALLGLVPFALLFLLLSGEVRPAGAPSQTATEAPRST